MYLLHTGANFFTMARQGPEPILAKIIHYWCVESEKWVEICFHHWTSEITSKWLIWQKNSNNPKIHMVTITFWGTVSVINWVNLSCWLSDLKVDIWQNLLKKCHFQIISHVQWWTKIFFPIFCILHIKNVWILLNLEMALATTVEMKFALMWVSW